jgi:hypothetical protein
MSENKPDISITYLFLFVTQQNIYKIKQTFHTLISLFKTRQIYIIFVYDYINPDVYNMYIIYIVFYYLYYKN